MLQVVANQPLRIRARLTAMTYLLQQVVYALIINLTEGNPDGESDVGRNIQTEAVHLRDAVYTAVRAEGGA